MIEVQVPKDITVYEPPLIGPLTTRQTICVVVTAAVEYCYYMILKALGISITATDSNSLPLLIGIALAVPILYLAIGKPYGMHAEVYIYYYLLPSVLAPKNRPYVTKLTYDSILEEIDKQEEEAELQKKGKKKKAKQPEKKKRPKAKSKQDIIYA